MLDTLLQLQKAARIHAYALIGEGGDVSYTPGVGTVDRGKCSPIGVPKRNVRYHNLLDVLEHRLQRSDWFQKLRGSSAVADSLFLL